MSENKQPQYESVDGISISVNTKKKEYPTLPVKEWLLAKITEVKKQLSDRADWGPKLHWTFSLVDEQYSGRKIWYDTSMIATTDSKLYALYVEIKGMKELPHDYIIKPNELVGKLCYIMVEFKKKYPEQQFISSIKHHDSTDNVASVTQQSSTTSAKKETVAVQSSVPVAEKQSSHSDEINLEEINIDDL